MEARYFTDTSFQLPYSNAAKEVFKPGTTMTSTVPIL